MFKYDIEYQNDNGVWVKLKHWIRPIMNKSTLDETHDETQIFLSCSPIDKPFKPFTKFIINITELNDKNEVVNLDTLYRVVIADEIKQVVFKETVDEEDNTVKGLYDHDIRLAEAAKELERYTVDNLSFTNEWNKAFKKDTINAEIVDQVLSNDFYDNSPNVLVASDYVLGRIFRYGQVYTTMSEVPKEVDINDTYLAKQLTTFSNNYRISDIDVNYSENATITIPSVESSNINEFLLYAYGLWHGIDFDGKWTDIDYYADINNFDVKIVIEYPNGLSQEVNQGDEIELTKDGKYKIKYECSKTN